MVSWARLVAQQVEMLAAKSDDLGSIPGTHMERNDSDFSVCMRVCTCTYRCTCVLECAC